MNTELVRAQVRALVADIDVSGLEALLQEAHVVDVAEALAEHTPAAVAHLLRGAEPRIAVDLLAHLGLPLQAAVLRLLTLEEQGRWIQGMAPDERADLFRRLEHQEADRLLTAVPLEVRRDLLRLSAYPEGSVGSITNSDVIPVLPTTSVDQAIARVRSWPSQWDTLEVVAVVEADRRLVGTLTLRELVLSPPHRLVVDALKGEPVVVRADWDAVQAIERIERHDLLAVPVVDDEERLLGMVTVADAMDAAREESGRKMMRFGGTAGMGGPELSLREASSLELYGARVIWLAVLTGFGVLTSAYVAAQEEILGSVIILAAFIAPIIDMGGNTGSQSATLVIRALALKEVSVRWRDVGFIILREVPVAAALGLTIAVLEAVLAWAAKGVGVEILWVVGLTMFIVTVLGGVLGALLPLAARRLGVDPATLSAPMITSIMDLLGVFIYFSLAHFFLGHLLVSGG